MKKLRQCEKIKKIRVGGGKRGGRGGEGGRGRGGGKGRIGVAHVTKRETGS